MPDDDGVHLYEAGRELKNGFKDKRAVVGLLRLIRTHSISLLSSSHVAGKPNESFAIFHCKHIFCFTCLDGAPSDGERRERRTGRMQEGGDQAGRRQSIVRDVRWKTGGGSMQTCFNLCLLTSLFQSAWLIGNGHGRHATLHRRRLGRNTNTALFAAALKWKRVACGTIEGARCGVIEERSSGGVLHNKANMMT